MKLSPLSDDQIYILNEFADEFDPRDRKEDDPIIEISFDFLSPSCKFHIVGSSSPILLSEYYDKALGYIVCVALCSLTQLLLLVKQIDKSNTQSVSKKKNKNPLHFKKCKGFF